MAKKKANVLGFVLVAIVLVALILVVVGMFVGQVVGTVSSNLAGASKSETVKLFDENAWKVTEFGDEKIGVSNVFGIISFIVTIVGLVLLLIDGIIHYILGKNFKIIRFVAIAVTFVGAILVLVAGLTMASGCEDLAGVDLGNAVKTTFTAGPGVWLGFVGGLVGAVGRGLGLLKKFA